ncbi:MAG TPA: hypothetical protein VK982_02120 [Bacteroidales bacterium]|nr:hypothetical protein [Bacteroidales bacterium]
MIVRTFEKLKASIDAELQDDINSRLSEEHRKIHPVWDTVEDLASSLEHYEQMLYEEVQKNLNAAKDMEEAGYRVDDKIEAIRLIMYSDIKHRYEEIEIHLSKGRRNDPLYKKMMDIQERFQEFKKKKKENCTCATKDQEKEIDKLLNEVINMRQELIDAKAEGEERQWIKK